MLDNQKLLNLYKWVLFSYVLMEIVLLVRYSFETPVGVLYLKDFANYWIAAKVMFEGDIQTIFTQSEFIQHHKTAFGPEYPWRNWSYPPTFLLFLAPLYVFEYHLALLVFLASTFALFYFATNEFVKNYSFEWMGKQSAWKHALFFLAVLSAIIVNIRYAQNGFLTSGLMLLGFAYWDRKAILAGLFIGLLTIKPQMGVLIPLFLLVDRNWLAIISATATTLGLIAISILVFGAESWINYIEITVPYQSRVLTEFGAGTEYIAMMLSGYMMARNFGIEGAAAWAIHGIFVIPTLLLVLYILFQVSDRLTRFTTLAVGTFLVSPYNFNYDGGVLSVLCALQGLNYRQEFRLTGPSSDVFTAEYLMLRYKLFFFAASLPVTGHLLAAFILQPAPLILLVCLATMIPATQGFYVNWRKNRAQERARKCLLANPPQS